MDPTLLVLESVDTSPTRPSRDVPTRRAPARQIPAPEERVTPHTDEQDDVLDPTLVVLLGQMDKDVAYAVQRFRIPHVPLRVVTDAVEAVKAAQAMKQAAVILTGARGTGKSYALRYVRRQIEAAEAQALTLNPEDHPLTRVLYLPRLTGRTVRECLLYLLRKVTRCTVRDRSLGVRLLEDDLLEQLIVVLRQKHYHLVFVDEMETATEAGIETLRRLLAPPPDESDDEDADGSGPGEESDAALTMVLAGTPALADRLARSDDVNGRWAKFVEVGGLDATAAAHVYETVFPGFASAITSMGRDAWRTLLAEQVVRGRRLTMRQLTNHCRWYFAKLFEASLHTSPENPILTREVTPFDRARFIWCFNDINKETPRISLGREPNGRESSAHQGIVPRAKHGTA